MCKTIQFNLHIKKKYLCFVSLLSKEKKRHCDAVDAKSPAACCVQTRSLKKAGWITSKFPDFLFPIWHQAPSIVAVTPTASHKHPLADCLPSQCWHWHFPLLSGRLIFMYFHCNYMALILDFHHALVFSPRWSFSSTTADQVELLPTLS